MAAKKVAGDAEVIDALSASSQRRGPPILLDPGPLHPFPARLPLRFAEYLIERLTWQQATVLDPLVGSGTVVTAARRLGRHAIGCDRDPLAVLIARAATTDFSSDRLRDLADRVLAQATALVSSGRVKAGELRASLPAEDNEFIRYWFPPKAQQQLFALAEAIGAESPGREREFALVVFSKLIIAKSAGASYALDISRSRPHKRLDKPVILPFDAWSSRFKNTINRLPFVDQLTALPKAIIHEADAREVPVDDSTVDLVFTSPPYRNAIDYLRAHKFSLVWMGQRLEQLRELRGTQVGSERGLWTRDGLPPGFERRLDRTVTIESRRAQVRRYLSDLHKILAEIRRVLRRGGVGIIVVGPSILASTRTDAHLVVAELAEEVGLRLITSARRDLVRARRSLPPPALGLGTPLADRMDHEMLVAVRKP